MSQAEAQSKIIEKFGLSFEEVGMPRIAGRIAGYMMLHEGSCSHDDQAETQQISKTSASTNTRLLVQKGLLDHVTRPGDRKDYYELTDEPASRMFEMVKQKMLRMHNLLSEATSTLPNTRTRSRAKLRDMQTFFEFMLDDIDERMQRWQRNSIRKSS
jgi:DNA-binding transcriptional regulator GbsR (MarR family)